MLLTLNVVLGLLIGAFCTHRWRRLGLRLTSPAGMAAFLWSAIWLVHLLDLFEFFEVSDTTAIYSLLPVLFLFLGEQFGLRLRASPDKWSINSDRLLSVLMASAAVAMLFAVAAFVSVYLIFGNPLEADVGPELKLARTELGASMLRGSPLFALVQYVNLSRCFVYLGLLSLVALWRIQPKAAWRTGVLVGVSGLLMDMSWGSRTITLDIAIFAAIAVAMNRRPATPSGGGRQRGRRMRSWVIVAFAAAVLILAADRITQATRPGREGQIAGVGVPYSLQQLAVYFTASLVIFDQTRDENEVRTYGLMSGAGLLNVAYLLRLYRNDELVVYDVLEAWESEYPSFGVGTDQTQGNTYTWLRYLYVDFGVAGFVVPPFLLGLIGGRAARRLSRQSERRGYFNTVVLGLCFYCAARSPIILGLRPDYVILGVVLAYVVHLFCLQRSGPAHAQALRPNARSQPGAGKIGAPIRD